MGDEVDLGGAPGNALCNLPSTAIELGNSKSKTVSASANLTDISPSSNVTLTIDGVGFMELSGDRTGHFKTHRSKLSSKGVIGHELALFIDSVLSGTCIIARSSSSKHHK